VVDRAGHFCDSVPAGAGHVLLDSAGRTGAEPDSPFGSSTTAELVGVIDVTAFELTTLTLPAVRLRTDVRRAVMTYAASVSDRCSSATSSTSSRIAYEVVNTVLTARRSTAFPGSADRPSGGPGRGGPYVADGPTDHRAYGVGFEGLEAAVGECGEAAGDQLRDVVRTGENGTVDRGKGAGVLCHAILTD
jgi:hypothetical protein